MNLHNKLILGQNNLNNLYQNYDPAESWKETLQRFFSVSSGYIGQTKLEDPPESPGSLCSSGNKTNCNLLVTRNDIKKVFLSVTDGNYTKAVAEATHLAFLYAKDKDRRVIVLKEKETGDILILPYSHRFSYIYKEKLSHKFEFLTTLRADFGFMTVTIKHRKDALSAYNLMLRNIRRLVSYIRDVLHRDFLPYTYAPEIKLEPSGELHPHIHILFVGLQYIPKDVLQRIKDYWHKRTGSSVINYVWISHKKCNRYSIFDYVFKYVTKSISSFNTTSVFSFAFGKHSYFISKDLRNLSQKDINAMNKDKDKEERHYLLVGSYFIEEIAPLFGDHLSKSTKFFLIKLGFLDAG